MGDLDLLQELQGRWCEQEVWALAGLQVEEDLGFIPGSLSSRRVGAGSFITFPVAAQRNPRAKAHERLPPVHFPMLHSAYYTGREPDKKRDNMKEDEDQRQSMEKRTK